MFPGVGKHPPLENRGQSSMQFSPTVDPQVRRPGPPDPTVRQYPPQSMPQRDSDLTLDEFLQTAFTTPEIGAHHFRYLVGTCLMHLQTRSCHVTLRRSFTSIPSLHLNSFPNISRLSHRSTPQSISSAHCLQAPRSPPNLSFYSVSTKFLRLCLYLVLLHTPKRLSLRPRFLSCRRRPRRRPYEPLSTSASPSPSTGISSSESRFEDRATTKGSQWRE